MTPLAELIRRAWPVLREAALMGRTITYTELAGRVGPPLTRRQVHRQLLTPLSALLRKTGLPQLPALVVRKDSGTPGAGYHGDHPQADPLAAWSLDLAACWAYPWPREVPSSLVAVATDHVSHSPSDPARSTRRTKK